MNSIIVLVWAVPGLMFLIVLGRIIAGRNGYGVVLKRGFVNAARGAGIGLVAGCLGPPGMPAGLFLGTWLGLTIGLCSRPSTTEFKKWPGRKGEVDSRLD